MNAIDRIGGEVFDSRDVTDAVSEIEDAIEDGSYQASEELRTILALNEWGEENVADWQYGETLIREDYFTEYAQQLAEDTSPFAPNSPEREALDMWPYRHIDWEAAAEELKQDYTEVEFQGRTYYVRAG